MGRSVVWLLSRGSGGRRARNVAESPVGRGGSAEGVRRRDGNRPVVRDGRPGAPARRLEARREEPRRRKRVDEVRSRRRLLEPAVRRPNRSGRASGGRRCARRSREACSPGRCRTRRSRASRRKPRATGVGSIAGRKYPATSRGVGPRGSRSGEADGERAGAVRRKGEDSAVRAREAGAEVDSARRGQRVVPGIEGRVAGGRGFTR